MKTLIKRLRLSLTALLQVPSTISYLATLTVLSLVAIASYTDLRQNNLQQDANAALINISGRQCTLALNIVLVSHLLIEDPNGDKQADLQAQLLDLAAQMQ